MLLIFLIGLKFFNSEPQAAALLMAALQTQVRDATYQEAEHETADYGDQDQ